MPLPLNAAARHRISYRTMRADDYAFTEMLYASTRAEELVVTGWTDEQKAAFLAQQHHAQHHHYQTHYADAEWLIVERDGDAIGRLYLHRLPQEIDVIDISLVPAARGAGIGGAILRDVLEEASESGRMVQIHVEKNNPARRLYQRLGFSTVEDKGVYDLMRWRAPA